MSLTLGDRIGGRYRVVGSLGIGGMASVFTVEDERTSARRVLKQLRADGASSLEAFRSEFALLSRVTHPRLTRVFDFGSCRVRSELLHYYIADWIDGRTLEAHAREQPGGALTALLDALEGLAVLHGMRIRHGDFTPANVIVDAAGRGTLIDLGCARPFGERADVISGTPGFMAPELLATGTGDGRADLFAVGATLRQVLSTSSLEKDARVAALEQRLVAEDPADRPASVAEVVEFLSGRRFDRGVRVEAYTLVGRERELAAFDDWLARVRGGAPGPKVFSIHGVGGVGASRFFRECVARAELALPVFRAHGGEARPVRWLLSHVLEDVEGWSSARAGLAAARALEHRSEPLLLALEDAHRLDAAEFELLLGCARSLSDTAPAGLIVCSREALPGTAAEAITLGPLDAPALRLWTEHTLSKQALVQVLHDTGGLPAAIEAELLCIARARGGPMTRDRSEAELQDAVAKLSAQDVERLARVVALDGELDVAASGATLGGGEDALLESGLLQREGARLRLRRSERLEALRAVLPPNALAKAHRTMAETLLGGAPGDGNDVASSAEIIRHLALADEVDRAEARLADSEAELSSDARVFARRSLPLLWRSKRLDTLVSIARLLLLANEPHLALSAVARVVRLRSTAEASAEARLLGAEALVRLGRSRRAERLLSRVQASTLPPPLRARAFEWLARVRMQRGDHARAVQAAEEGLALSPPPPQEAALLEVLGVASSYLGRTEQADEYFARVLATLDEASDSRAICRLLGYRAISAFRAGRVVRAAEDHARALELAERHAFDDLVAVSSLNLGTAQQQLGDLGAALASYERGLVMARAIGRESTELTLRYNLANLRTELGDLRRAHGDIDALERRADAAGFAQFTPAVALLRAEIAVLVGEHGKAEEELDRAARLYGERELSRELIEVDAARSELELSRQRFAVAEQLASKAQTAADALGATDLSLRAALVIARSQVERRDEGALTHLHQALERATAAKQRLLEARILTELWHATDALGRADAPGLLARARRAWDRTAQNLPDELRAVFFLDARRAQLSRPTQPIAVAAGASAETEALRRLLSLSRRMNSSLSLERVLDYAVEAAVDLSGAERGILLLAGADEPRVAAARPSAAQGDRDPPSGSIVRRVLESEDAVMATDVQSDERFAGQRSVHALRLKSVLCVPVSTPNGVLGVLYVDSRVQRARFGEGDRGVLQALADQVAVAITNARLHSELERHARELAEQKQTIERLSQRKDRELERLREQLDVQRRALGLRYDYAQIIGRGPKMRAVLEKLDRIIDSNASVLVQGESGTGKELVARAIHVHGAHRDGAFVGVNCAALPETLLESELFGHVRGAFTGADRDKKGLMLAANGGTLFLDEVGEMPLATQSRLLRVLQEREVRPVGSTRAVPLEVRLVCATHRDLRAEVAAGRFREDLFYRIAVVVTVVPPLRERQEDLPALCRSILSNLAREAGTEPSELDREALRLLAAHPFPGNVRELVNVLTRAFVLRSGARITASDLDLAGASRRPKHTENRGEFEAEERQVILSALAGARWNVSTVARQLGIPRNTLYRKLRKYGLARRDPP